MTIPICPYCGMPATLTDSSAIYKGRDYGKFWICVPCDAYVGCHSDRPGFIPLGTLANKELREWRKAAHDRFDPMWKSGRMTRHEAYTFMAENMGLRSEEAHIGMFDVQKCKKLIQLIVERKS